VSKGKVLVVDDALEMAQAVVEYLQRHGFEAEGVDSGSKALDRFRAAPPDAVLTDLRMKGMDGMDLLQAIQEIDRDVPVVIMTAFGAVESAVEAIQRGAYHYVTKPFKVDVIRLLMERALAESSMRAENAVLRRTVREVLTTGTLVGRSAGIKAVMDLVMRVAPVAAPVLILGETGTGKELVARAIHNEGPRKDAPFVAVNCAALPEALLESELFGHVRGAFTGATQTRRGLFVEANDGTLLLDEVGEMPMALQAKLLRVLETGEVRSVGSDAPRKTDVRIIAATHRDLPALVKDNKFRQDLFFRLNVVPISVPPLRDRREDVPMLLEHFLKRSRDRVPASPVRSFSPEATKILLDYPWPGNVRELENLVDRWVITGQGAEIGPADVRGTLGDRNIDPLQAAREELLPLHAVEQRYIAWVLERVGGNKTRAAEVLQIDPSTLYRREKQGKHSGG
jgi:two-component system response regulator HydG